MRIGEGVSRFTLLQTVNLASSSSVFKAVIPIEISSTLRTGTVTVTQASAGHRVTIEGLGVYLG